MYINSNSWSCYVCVCVSVSVYTCVHAYASSPLALLLSVHEFCARVFHFNVRKTLKWINTCLYTLPLWRIYCHFFKNGQLSISVVAIHWFDMRECDESPCHLVLRYFPFSTVFSFFFYFYCQRCRYHQLEIENIIILTDDDVETASWNKLLSFLCLLFCCVVS